MGLATQAEAAYVVVRSPSGQASSDMAQALLTGTLTPSSIQSTYVVTNPSSPIQVLGSDASVAGSATFVDQNGIPGQEYVVAAVKGTMGYALIVDVPTAIDATNQNLAQTILGTFQLSVASTSASSGASPPLVAAPSTTPLALPTQPSLASTPVATTSSVIPVGSTTGRCSADDWATFQTVSSPFWNQFQDASKVNLSLAQGGRSGDTLAVQNLVEQQQAARRQYSQITVPACAATLQTLEITAMNDFIDMTLLPITYSGSSISAVLALSNATVAAANKAVADTKAVQTETDRIKPQ